MSIKDAFFAICNEAEPSKAVYVSLYVDVPFYGGPEEGGWWGSDTHLVASQRFYSAEQAEAAKQRVTVLAQDMTEQSKQQFYSQCRAECDWLEARGLDDDFLREPDGESTFFVVVEEVSGSQVNRGCRHYE